MTGRGPVPVVADDTHRRHDPPFELNAGQVVAPVWESPARHDRILAALGDAGHGVVTPEPFDDEALHAVHDPDMVAFLRDGYAAWRAAGGPEVMIADTFRHPRMGGGGRPSASVFAQLGWFCFDTATPLVAGSFAAGRAAVDIALTAASLVADGAPAAYGLTRPPGHHAGVDYFGGFCLFNHAAVAARWLTAGGRVTVLDLDVHHGNGTQDIFWRAPDVQYVSLHGDPDHLYPFFTGFADEVGEGPGRGTTRNLPLGEGTGDDAYLDALQVAVEEIDRFAPTTLVVSLGLDTTAEDPIGSLALSPAAYPRIGRVLADLGLPTVVLQEGGYALDRLGPSAVGLLAPLGS
ncbi:MAG TPA: histone deacetylase family protein [Egicoccus sp.]|nr:histone deacetylase family protein [Egicoccus sp.]HSK24786.1 histone deacetylase family protein [Egicoccus sp.]